MSGTLPEQAAAPSSTPFELLWERHRRKFNFLVAVALAGTAIFYGIRYYEQSVQDRAWSSFASATLLDEAYTNTDDARQMAGSLETSLVESMEKVDISKVDSLKENEGRSTPYLQWILANKAIRERNWDRADSILTGIEQNFPNHHVCLESDYPVQSRGEVVEQPPKTKPVTPKEPELKAAKKGSMTRLFREQVQAGRTFVEPTQFAKPQIPADSPRYRIKFSGDMGEVVIALLPSAAPLHCKQFQELVDAKFWDAINVDEVQRPTKQNKRWATTQLHFGFNTRSENVEEWETSKPSQHLVDEVTGLSHFPGALAARPDSDGKSCVDRLWLGVEDSANLDGQRQVFGYVETGLEVVKKICESSLSSTEEEQRGQGRPSPRVKVESVVRV